MRVLKNATAGMKLAICGGVGQAHTPTDSLFPFGTAAFSTPSGMCLDTRETHTERHAIRLFTQGVL
jgi:hypothetical protein